MKQLPFKLSVIAGAMSVVISSGTLAATGSMCVQWSPDLVTPGAPDVWTVLAAPAPGANPVANAPCSPIDPATGLPAIDPVTGLPITGSVVKTYYANSPILRKFVDTLPGLNAAGVNTFAAGKPGEYIPLGVADQTTYPGSDYYVLATVQHDQWMHSDLPKATTQRSYVQIYDEGVTAPAGAVQLKYPDGTPIKWPKSGAQVFAYDNPHYLGPIIVGTKGRPTRIKMMNFLPTGAAGNLFVPVDHGLASADTALPENRMAVHLHGGDNPWISDGTPNQWFGAVGDPNTHKKGGSLKNVPDMPDPGEGGQTLFYPNDQTSRFIWYHDHTFGLTRQNAYVGEAAGYLVIDDAELALLNGGTIKDHAGNNVAITKALPGTLLEQIPLVIQDKTFVPTDVNVQDSKWDTTKWGKPGDLWFPHVYEPAVMQTAGTLKLNPAGRWDYGPADPLWAGTAALLNPTGEFGDNSPFLDGSYGKESTTPEAFNDTALVNGVAYPTMTVNPQAYRFRVLAAANDRYFNLSLWVADSAVTSADGRTNTEVQMVPADGTSYTYLNPNTGLSETYAVPNDPVAYPAGVVHPGAIGPDIVQFGNESGLLPAPVVHKSRPIVLNAAGEAVSGGFYLGDAERGDLVIDFSKYAGKTLILYNDSPSPVPGGDPRYDYYTNGPDWSAEGGAAPTLPGFGPNTRTIMQIKVANVAPVTNFNLATLQTELSKAYNATAEVNPVPNATISVDAAGNVLVKNGATTVTPEVKVIQGDYDVNFGRLIANFGTELPGSAGVSTPLAYIDRPSEVVKNGELQFWYIKNIDADNHPIHFHLFNVKVIGRIGFVYDAAGNVIGRNIKAPLAEETGWKEVVQMWPGEDIVVALQPKTPALPFGLPNSSRLLDPSLPAGINFNNTLPYPAGGTAPLAFVQFDPDNHGYDSVTGTFTGTNNHGNALLTANEAVNLGWEYVWHCHILGHEENDLMRPLVFLPNITPPAAPGNLGMDATGKLTWTDATPADTLTTSFPRGNTSNEIGFLVERAPITGGVVGTYAPLPGKDSSAYISTTVNTLANATSYQDTVATTADYSYRVSSVNAVGQAASVFSYTAPLAPSNVAVVPGVVPTSATPGTANVTWADNSGNESAFRVERATLTANGWSAFSPIGTVAANGTAFTDPNIAAFTDYQYRVVAENGAKESISTNVATLNQAPAAPLGVSVDTTGLVSWIDNSTNEVSFTIERAPVTTDAATMAQTVGAFAVIGSTTANTSTFQDPTFAANSDYQYRVTAVNTKGSAVSNVFTLSALPVAASNVAVDSTGTVTWLDNSTNETGFRIDRATVTSGVVGAFAPITTTAANAITFKDATIAANTDYQYQVVALNGTLIATASAPASLLQAPKAATGLAVATAPAMTARALTLNWVDNSTNEDGFSVEASTDGGVTFTSMPATPVGQNIVTYPATVTPATAYTFRVAATKNLAGYVPVYTTITATTPAELLAVTGLTPTATLTNGVPQVQLSWVDASTGETTYTVERCSGTATTCTATAGNWGLLTSMPALTTPASGGAMNYTDTTLVAGTAYFYRVKALTGATVGVATVTAQVSTPISMIAPTNLTAASPTGAGVTLTWTDSTTNETSFQVERADAATPTVFAVLGTVTRTTALKTATGGSVTYADATALGGASYIYQVRSVNTTGTTVSASTPSNQAPITLAMPAPTGATAIQSGASIVVKWTDKSATETGFEVLRTDPTGLTATFAVARTATQGTSVNGTVSYTDATAVVGTPYTYAIRAVNAPAAGVATYSVYTAPVNAMVVLPTPTQLEAAVPTTGTGFVLSWVDNATFETAYRVDRAAVTLVNGQVPAGTVFTTVKTIARTGNATTTTGAVSYADTTAAALPAGQVYAYVVYAVSGTGVSAPSNIAHTSGATTSGGAPTGLTAVTTSGTAIALSWVDHSTNETSFLITRTDPAGVAATFTVARTAAQGTSVNGVVSYSDTSAVLGTTYTYSVAAVTPTGNLTSAPITATLTLAAPTNATVAAAATGITVGWTDMSTNETGFQIVRNVAAKDAVTGALILDAAGNPTPAAGTTASVIAVTSTTTQKTATNAARTYTDTTVLPGVTYYYTVASVSGAMASAPVYTAPATITTGAMTAPTVPTVAIASATSLRLTWTDLSNNETGFVIERSVDGGTTWTTLGATLPGATVTRTATQKTAVNGAVTYTDTLVAPVVYGQYQYRVKAVMQTGTGAAAVTSAESAWTYSSLLDFTPPAAPTTLTVAAGTVTGTLNLSWVDVASTETGYTVQVATNATFTKGLKTFTAPVAAGTGSTVTFSPSGLTKGTKYFVRVAAANGALLSTYVASTVAVAAP